ncbi:MAG: helix-turn-helix transcriptional regulator [Prevotellaceae bacterium]|jgi:transcriptional regulator with XRE-family HTH domain|nr:helix-turn-helix transcriptional regulator [Prevotellaceae bacterium]
MNYSKIRLEIEKQKMTVKNFCQKVGISEQGFSKMLDNQSIKIEILEKMSDVLGVPISYWFEENTEGQYDHKKERPALPSQLQLRSKMAKNQTKSIDLITSELNHLLKSLVARS